MIPRETVYRKAFGSALRGMIFCLMAIHLLFEALYAFGFSRSIGGLLFVILIAVAFVWIGRFVVTSWFLKCPQCAARLGLQREKTNAKTTPRYCQACGYDADQIRVTWPFLNIVVRNQ